MNRINQTVMKISTSYGLYFLIDNYSTGQILSTRGYEFILEVVREAERLGYRVLWLPDHYMSSMSDVTFDTWTVLSAIATQTSTIKLASCVSPIPFHIPSTLAKIVATVDNVSQGRAILGVGAGYYEREFDGYGIPFDPFRIRVRKMDEGIGIIKKLWTADSTISHSGEYYKLKEAVMLPKPVQKPHPPIWFGGVSKRLVKSAARYGNGWIPPASKISARGIMEMNELLSKFAIEAGRDPSEITKAVAVTAIIGKDQQEIRARIKTARVPSDLRKKMMIGTPRQCQSRLREYSQSGVEHFAIGIRSAQSILEELQLYAEEVAPNI